MAQQTLEPAMQPAAAVLMQMSQGALPARALGAAAVLGIADQLVTGPLDCETLAARTGVHAPSLYRLLRALASYAIFAEDGEGRFILTPLAQPLRDDAPDSVRPMLLLQEDAAPALNDLLGSIRTGEAAFNRIHGRGWWEHFAEQPETEAIHQQALASHVAGVVPSLLDAYDFTGIDTLVDVGGGYGALLARILQAYPAMRGVLFEQPHVAAQAGATLEKAGVASRCTTIAGDFFRAVPEGGDVYLMMRIMRDWDDERAAAILARCRAAMRPDARLLLVEMIVPPGNAPSISKIADLFLLAILPGARDRTEPEFRALLDGAGFRLTRIVPTNAPLPFSVIEAAPA